jgi:hypothetical protein
MYEIINKHIAAIGGSVGKVGEMSLKVYLPNTGQKNGNLKYYIEMSSLAIPAFLSKCKIVRLECYANNKKSYKDVLNNRQLL